MTSPGLSAASPGEIGARVQSSKRIVFDVILKMFLDEQIAISYASPEFLGWMDIQSQVKHVAVNLK